VPTEDWLNKINAEFSEENIPHIQRPLEALRRYSIEFRCSIAFGSSEANSIFEWFKANTKSDAHYMGPIFSSTYFYDGEFWDLEIPVFFGTVNLNPYDSLSNMPAPIMQKLQGHAEKSIEYVRHWADCFDFGLGFDEIREIQGLNSFGKDFLSAGYEELSSAASLLRKTRANPRAVMDARMALEMFFKAYAGLKNLLTEREAMKISHHLDKGLDKMIDISGYEYLRFLKPRLSIFPDISDRYKAQSMSKPELWQAFQLAQMIGALVTRQFSEYDVLSDVEQAIDSN
jgi:hypothetical protein